MMNKLEAEKVLAVVLFNGLKEKMDHFEKSVNCRVYRVSCFNENEHRVTFITPNLFIRHNGDYIGCVTDNKCKLEEDDDANAELVVDILLAVSQVFIGDAEFTVSADTNNENDGTFMVLDVNTYDVVEKLDALHDLLIEGLTNVNF